jgi:hypothetical protein
VSKQKKNVLKPADLLCGTLKPLSNLAGSETSIFLVLKYLTSVHGIEWLIEITTSRLLELKNEGAGVVELTACPLLASCCRLHTIRHIRVRILCLGQHTSAYAFVSSVVFSHLVQHICIYMHIYTEYVCVYIYTYIYRSCRLHAIRHIRLRILCIRQPYGTYAFGSSVVYTS